MATVRPITHRQMRATTIWVRDGFKSKARALLEAGYGKSIARHPRKVFESPAVLNELEMLGYNAWGLRTEPQAIDLGEIQPPEPPPLKLTKEQLQLLKGRLIEIGWVPDSFARKEETPQFTSPPSSLAADLSQKQDIDKGGMFSL